MSMTQLCDKRVSGLTVDIASSGEAESWNFIVCCTARDTVRLASLEAGRWDGDTVCARLLLFMTACMRHSDSD